MSFIESGADDGNIKDTNVGLQASLNVETSPGMEETDERESLHNKMYMTSW